MGSLTSICLTEDFSDCGYRWEGIFLTRGRLDHKFGVGALAPWDNLVYIYPMPLRVSAIVLHSWSPPSALQLQEQWVSFPMGLAYL